MEEFLNSPQGTWAIVGGCVVLGLIVVGIKNFRVRERKHLSDLAGALSHAGVPEQFVTPISDLAVGDDAGAIGALVKAAATLRTADGWNALIKGIVTAAWADPTRKAALTTLLSDLQAGAPDSQIVTDIGGIISANPLSKVVGTGPLATDLGHVADRIAAIKSNPLIANVLGALQGLPAGAQTAMAKILADIHSLGQTSANPAPAATGTQAASTTGGASSSAPAADSTTTHVFTVPPGSNVNVQTPAAT